MVGKVSQEVEAKVPASNAWELFSTLELVKLVQKELPQLFNKIDLIEGDGGVGTVLEVTFPPDTPGFTYCKEKFLKIDNEKRVKETEVIEGGYLDLGFTLYLVRFEVIEKETDSCIIKTTIEYDLKEEAAANASLKMWEDKPNGDGVILLCNKVELVEGGGGEGTVFRLTFAAGTPGATSYTEKFTMIDNEKLIKEAEVIEGGYLDLGFNLYRVHFEVIKKGKELCIIKTTIEYDVKEEAAWSHFQLLPK